MQTIDYCILVLYLAGMLVAGLWMARKASRTIESYFLGDRNIPWWMLGISGMASNLDMTGTMINTALFFVLGVGGFFVEIRGGVVLVLVFLMIFMGKWTRRSGVMTVAEWMHFRFGKTRQGDLARIVAALGTIVTTVAMVSYFCTGAGKFVAEFFGIPDFLGLEGRFWGALCMISAAMCYTVASGFYGVILTDLFQSVLIFIAIVWVSIIALVYYPLPETFSVSIPMKDGTFQTMETTRQAWTSLIPSWQRTFDSGSDYAVFNLFGVALMFYFFRTVLVAGFEGPHGYMAQRYFAARSDRDAGLLSALWTVLLSFRWPFIAGMAMMGIAYIAQNGVIADPEMVLPVVLAEMVPTGVKGLLLAGLIAAAMSTFDSTVNCGASFWVRDIYQAYLAPTASEKQLIRQSRWSSLVIVGLGLLLSLTIRNINDIWGWITMSLGVGMLVPMVVRWYWWRMNGYGFAIGTFAGMTAAVVQRLCFPEWPEYQAFCFVAGLDLLGIVVGTLATEATDEAVLENFYRKTRPFGFWGPVRNNFDVTFLDKVRRENRRDLAALCLAVPWQLSLFLMWTMFVMREWVTGLGLLAAFGGLSLGLYYIWYRHLEGDDLEGTEVQLESAAHSL